MSAARDSPRARTAALFRLAVRELAHQRGFSLFFAVNLALGLLGAITLASVQSSIEETLAGRSRSFLAADLRIASTHPLSDSAWRTIEEEARPVAVSRPIQLYTMVAAGGQSRLAEVRGIDERFPLSGTVVLSGSGPVGPTQHRTLQREHAAWVDPSILVALDVELGDVLRLGHQEFRVTDTVLRDTGLSVRAIALAPRVYIAAEHMQGTGLIQTTSRVEYQTLLRLPSGTNATSTAEALRRRLDDPAVRITSHEEAIAAVSGAYSRVTRYLGAISLIALCLAGVACGYAFRSYVAGRVGDLAILMSLGASRTRAQALLVFQLTILGAAAATIAVVLAAALLPLTGRALADLLPAHVDLRVGSDEIGVTYAVALLFGTLSCLPFLASLRRLRIAALFQEHMSIALAAPRTRDILWYVPAAALIFVLARAQLGVLPQALGFMAILGVAAIAVSAIARGLLGSISRLDGGRGVAWRLALRQLSPRRRASRTAFVALALSSLLLVLPAQLRAVLDERLAPPPASEIPSLFLFDIQPEQTEPLNDLARRSGTHLQRVAPMVRARLDAINGSAIADVEIPRGNGRFDDPDRLRTRRYNLTYQSAIASTETLVEGRDFSGVYDPDGGQLPEISMEVDFARDLAVGVGDTLRFDIQGVPVEGRIVNLRSVDWSSMQPNFFVSLQPGVIEAAPAVFLASVPSMPTDERDRLQAAIVAAFPNVSVIDVTRIINRATGLISQLEWALGATTVTTVLVGFFLVVAIARDEARARHADINLLKILGARHSLLRRSVSAEFALLAVGAAGAGVALAITIGAVLAYRFLDTGPVTAWWPLVATLVLLPALSSATARLATRRVLRERPSLSMR